MEAKSGNDNVRWNQSGMGLQFFWVARETYRIEVAGLVSDVFQPKILPGKGHVFTCHGKLRQTLHALFVDFGLVLHIAGDESDTS